ncbi:hypothetical protein ACTG15_14815 [Aeromonas sp. 164P]
MAKIPYTSLLNFAILSCMRISEVCKIKWSGVDEKNRAVLVEDRKDPRGCRLELIEFSTIPAPLT